ncbi:hypothetical protein GWI33_005881 [Rhynchophorus ferrugineus]|uniref:Uncharacterized protein n=1 Tax=Rhynchophorus ferrugineus TaxID=354439 RepID=A0A834IL27_RHYFE|nr:hypothetical protein GWI33_005881 [Rhynchophorus ferrugineus]
MVRVRRRCGGEGKGDGFGHAKTENKRGKKAGNLVVRVGLMIPSVRDNSLMVRPRTSWRLERFLFVEINKHGDEVGGVTLANKSQLTGIDLRVSGHISTTKQGCRKI